MSLAAHVATQAAPKLLNNADAASVGNKLQFPTCAANSKDVALFNSCVNRSQGVGAAQKVGMEAKAKQGGFVTGIVSKIDKVMDKPQNKIFAYLQKASKDPHGMSSAKLMLTTAMVFRYSIATQTEMGVVKKFNETAQTFLRNQG